MVSEQGHDGHQNARSAEPALQRVGLTECPLEGMEFAGMLGGQPLDRGDGMPVGLHREGQTRPDGVTVEQDRASTTDPVLTSDVGTGQLESLSQEITE